MLKKIVFLLLITAAGNCIAQDKELIDINYSTAKLKYNDTTSQSGMLNAKFRVPLYYNDGNIFMASVDYRHVTLSSFPEYYSGPLQGASLLLLYNRKISDKNSIALIARFGLFSDFKKAHSRDFQYGFGINYDIKYSEEFKTGFGFFYARQFFGNQIVPFMNIDWKIGEKWRLTGRLPIKEKLLYQFSAKISAGIELALENSSYRLTENEAENNFIKITDCAALAKFEYKFSKSWQLNLAGGVGLIQRYEIYDESSDGSWSIFTIALNKKEKPLQEIKSRGFTGQIGISYNLF
ncbi:hypothetical protein HNP37_002204 [Flavobacterium nitrogenifigens]|uniref:DUF6268 domain-containing protein n=2 Tax=Flavobacterium TaxID=237 RepID=A0A7W7IX16_9FLAO|nr:MULTISPECIES: DUF6268 family outer membrane beta-barrel protein [Flavobacterium]MBB4802131.1 hypothetical protein [Flavobacterium nitrogenifigens]MBB6387089.1 hypothetical protein [Flavobacterium notoginsengisoli]